MADCDGFRASERNLRGERDVVAITNLKRSGRAVHWYEFVARRKNRDARAAGDLDARVPYLRSHGELGVSQAYSTRDHGFSNARFCAGEDVILPQSHGLLENNMIALFARVFVHYHGVCAARHGRAGENANTFTRTDGAVESGAGAAFADQAQLRAGLGDIRGADGESIANRTIEGRIVAVGNDIFRQDAADSRGRRGGEIESFAFSGAGPRGENFDDFGARFFEGNHHGLQPGGELGAARHDRGVALGAGRDHADFNLQVVGNKIQIITRGQWQIADVANTRRRFHPAR